MKIFCYLLIAGVLTLTGCTADGQSSEMKRNWEEVESMSNYFLPAEEQEHEGTWLTWPHQYTYGVEYREEIEDIWVQMVYALNPGENVHIIAYDAEEKHRIEKLLKEEGIPMEAIDFVIAKSDDVWARDTGPMFVFDKNHKMVIADFAFDGWGKKMPYEKDNKIPQVAASAKNFEIIEIPEFVLEGGAVELDGKGTLLAAKSSVISKNRNSDMTVAQAEEYLSKYLGVSNFIWIEGVIDQDITDAHIDGMARFYDEKTLMMVSEDDFFELYDDMKESDYDILLNARNAEGVLYEQIELPMTEKNVKGLDYKGSYLNYYIGNEVVLLPVYNDKNDEIAIEILAELYADREIVPIDVTSLYKYGGMLHCVTQQQPME